MEQCVDAGPVRFGHRPAVALEQDAEHVGVAHCAERVPEPAELGAQAFAPLLVENAAERPQVGAQPPGRDPGLVHALRVVADADHGIVGEQPVHRRGHDGLHELGDRRALR